MAKAGLSPSPAQQIGTTSEALVLARLVELGYGVSVPFGNLRYDLVVDDGKELIRAQVKTGRVRGNKIAFPIQSSHRNSGGRVSYVGDADDFIVYCPELNEMYRVAVETVGDVAQAYLWIDEPRRRTGRPVVHWAREHVFEESAYLKQFGPLKACESVHPDAPSRMAEKRSKGGAPRRYCKECYRIYHQRRRSRQAAESDVA